MIYFMQPTAPTRILDLPADAFDQVEAKQQTAIQTAWLIGRDESDVEVIAATARRMVAAVLAQCRSETAFEGD